MIWRLCSMLIDSKDNSANCKSRHRDRLSWYMDVTFSTSWRQLASWPMGTNSCLIERVEKDIELNISAINRKSSVESIILNITANSAIWSGVRCICHLLGALNTSCRPSVESHAECLHSTWKCWHSFMLCVIDIASRACCLHTVHKQHCKFDDP